MQKKEWKIAYENEKGQLLESFRSSEAELHFCDLRFS